jgi:hypothetical protein
MHYDTRILTVFTVGLPFLGRRTTVTVQVPFLMPRTVLPTKTQYFVPRVIEIRMDPCDRFGIFKETADAIFAAVIDRFRESFTTVKVLALVRPTGVLVG